MVKRPIGCMACPSFMVLQKRDYQGSGIDIFVCPACGRGYEVSYSICQVTHNPQWDVNLKAKQQAEQEANEKWRNEQIQELERKLQQLRGG